MTRFGVIPTAEPPERIPYADTWTAPKRIQRRRTKGWRMPPGAVYVGRPTYWGNPSRIGDCLTCQWDGGHPGDHQPMTARDTVDEYRNLWEALVWTELTIANRTAEENRLCGVSGRTVDLFAGIRGRDLVCWCPLDQPCHADVLLELANR